MNEQYKIITDSYKKLLKTKKPRYTNTFEKRLIKDKDAAITEAVMYYLVRNVFDTIIKPNDINGGPDFFCEKNGREYYLESTHFKIENEKSRVQLNKRCIDKTQNFYPDINKIKVEIHEKAKQFRNIQDNTPGILAVGTFHDEGYLIRRPDYTRIISGLEPVKKNATDNWSEVQFDPSIWYSAFVRIKEMKKQIISERISAVLFISLAERLLPPQILIHGIHHPSPICVFNEKMLPGVPFWKTDIEGNNAVWIRNGTNKLKGGLIIENCISANKREQLAINLNKFVETTSK